MRARRSRSRLSLEICAIPVCEIRGGFVGGPAKFKKRGAGIGGLARVVIHPAETLALRAVVGLRRRNFGVAITGRFGRGVGIKRGVCNITTTGPPADAADFVRVSFPRDGVCTGTVWCAAAGETRDAQIETAPEKMDWAAFAEETSAKFFEDGIDRDENLPETVRVGAIVRCVRGVLIEADGIGNFDRHVPNID